jgi:hypothetical protein
MPETASFILFREQRSSLAVGRIALSLKHDCFTGRSFNPLQHKYALTWKEVFPVR